MSLTNEQIRDAKRIRKRMANRPGLHPDLRKYFEELDLVLGSSGEDVLPTTTTSTTTSSTTAP